MSAHLPLTLVGGYARHALTAERSWRVLQVSRRSFYCRSAEGSLVLVGPASLGAGPLHALWGESGSGAPVFPEVGTPVAVDDRLHASRASLTLGLRAAREWQPPAPPDWTPAALRRSLAWLGRAADRAPADGVGRLVGALVAGAAGEADTAALSSVARHAWPGLAGLSDWSRAALAAGCAASAPPDAVASLVGLGPGLTPSGDDALAGALLALHGFSRGDLAERLAAWLRPRAAGRTGLVSLAHLERAERGEGAAVLHDALAALASGVPETVPAAVSRLGHSSGWDALAGVATVGAAWLDVTERGGRPRASCR